MRRVAATCLWSVLVAALAAGAAGCGGGGARGGGDHAHATTGSAVSSPGRVAPFGTFGVVLNPTGSDGSPLPAASIDAQAAAMARAGVESIRVPFSWAAIEPRSGSFDWRRTDPIVQAAAAHGRAEPPAEPDLHADLGVVAPAQRHAVPVRAVRSAAVRALYDRDRAPLRVERDPFVVDASSVTHTVALMAKIVAFVRRVMTAHGDGHKPILLTEVTWPADVGIVPRRRLLGLETTPAGARARLAAAYAFLSRRGRALGITQAYWYTWASSFDRHDPAAEVSYDFAGLNRITPRGGFVPQPILRTYTAAAARFEGCAKGQNARTCR